MSIKPNVIILQESDSDIKSLSNVYLEQIPQVTTDLNKIDSNYIEKIRSQPLPNEIGKITSSSLSDDIKQMVQLLGSYCKINSITEIKKIVNQIHSTLPSKGVSNVKNWVKLLTGLHPQIDSYVKTLPYWKPYSEIIGTNTIMYYADTSCIDITFWSSDPVFITNEIVWFTDAWASPSYIRESIREKLSDSAVEFIQTAGVTTSRMQYKNLVLETERTTKSGSGAETYQDRPIEPDVVHGASLNNDWYNQELRTMSDVKEPMYKYARKHLDQGGVFVHVLVNHLNPLEPDATSEKRAIVRSSPIGVEETFPRGNSAIAVATDQNGNRILKNATQVDNSDLGPEIV